MSLRTLVAGRTRLLSQCYRLHQEHYALLLGRKSSIGVGTMTWRIDTAASTSTITRFNPSFFSTSSSGSSIVPPVSTAPSSIKESAPTSAEDSLTTLTPSKSAPTTPTTNVTQQPAPTTSESSPSPTTSTFPALPKWLEELLEVWKKQSGTAEVLKLKEQVSMTSQAFDAAQVRATQARRHLDESMLLWERTNGQHLQLLQRRDSWTSEDAQQFATLVGKEVQTRTQMEAARSELTKAESVLSHCQLEYMNAMRKRYHEEQIWQDTWRVLGTYGTWALIVLNSCVFLLSQFFHYRREARKMKHLENLVKDNVASQQAFQETMVAERQAFAEAAAAEKAAKAAESQSTMQTLTSMFASHPSEQEEKEEASETKTEETATTTKSTATTASKSTETSPTPTEQEQEQHQLQLPQWLVDLGQTEWVQRVVHSEAVTLTVAKSKAAWTVAKQQTKELVQDIHVPSAVLGASVTGVTMIVATMLLSLNTKSR